jgi:hypothetical protein
LDADKVSDRIAEAETALVIRARELFGSAGDNIEEEQAVDDAMYALHALRSALKCRANSKNTSEDLAAWNWLEIKGDDGCESHFGTSQQDETGNKRPTSHDRTVLEQEPAYRAGQIRFRPTERPFVGNQTGTIGHDETLCLRAAGNCCQPSRSSLEYLKEGGPMPREPRKTWQYFAQAVIQEDDPEKLTDLMEQLYRALDEDEKWVQTGAAKGRKRFAPGLK